MNIKQNFKQSRQIIRQNKLFSGIYIAGTAITISMVMIIAIVWIAKTAELYPEVNRSKMMSIKGVVERTKDKKGYSSYYSSHKFTEDFVRSTKTFEYATEIINSDEASTLRTTGDDKYKVRTLYTDHYFWKIMEFRFLEGMPYTQEDVSSKISKAVISESVAKKYFGSVDNAVGQHFTLDFVDYAVCGVVKDVSAIMSVSYADIWLPITTTDQYYDNQGDGGYLGLINTYILSRSSKDFSKIRSEVNEKIASFNNTSTTVVVDPMGQPEPYIKGILRKWSNAEPDIRGYILKLSLVVLILLLVPAINLAGMISSRMTRRKEEMGIRKTFGATKKSILSQIINENLLLTLIGGGLGLLLSYLILIVKGDTIVGLIIEPGFGDALTNVDFSISMLMNPWVFVIALVICLVLNLLAAIIPAAHSLKNNIVDSLNVKK